MLQSPPIKTKGLMWSLLLLLLLMLLFFAPDTGCCTSDAACSVGEAPLTPVLCSAEHCEVVEVVTACILQPEEHRLMLSAESSGTEYVVAAISCAVSVTAVAGVAAAAAAAARRGVQREGNELVCLFKRMSSQLRRCCASAC
jgi:hypothetical protein